MSVGPLPFLFGDLGLFLQHHWNTALLPVLFKGKCSHGVPTNAVYLGRFVSLPAKSTSTRSRWVCEQCRFRHDLAIFSTTQFVQLGQVSVVKDCCGKLIPPLRHAFRLCFSRYWLGSFFSALFTLTTLSLSNPHSPIDKFPKSRKVSPTSLSLQNNYWRP